jgi:transmembrane sensor
MSTDNHQSQREALRHEAYEWLVRLTSGSATTADAEGFGEWCRRSPAHVEAFANANAVWDNLGPASEVSGRTVAPRRVSRRLILTGAIAASVGGLLLVRPPLELWPSWAELVADYRTGIGEQKQISVSGGVLDLNTRTSLAVRSSDGHGAVELIAGEVAIAARASQFEVIAADGRSAASAASFNVRLDGGKVCVTCLEGEVLVEHQGRRVLVQKGQQVFYGDRELTAAAAVDPATVTAWHRGMLVFHHAPLAGVIDEINRYRPGKLVLMDRRLGSRPIEASFRLDRVDDIITLVHEAFGAHVTRLPGGIVLLS